MNSPLKTWQVLVIVTLMVMNGHAIARGIRWKNIVGVGLATCSLLVLPLSIRIFNQINATDKDDHL